MRKVRGSNPRTSKVLFLFISDQLKSTSDWIKLIPAISVLNVFEKNRVKIDCASMLSRRSSPLVYFSHLRSPARQKERRTCHSEGQVEISARFCNPDNKKATFVSRVKPPVLTLPPPPPKGSSVQYKSRGSLGISGIKGSKKRFDGLSNKKPVYLYLTFAVATFQSCI